MLTVSLNGVETAINAHSLSEVIVLLGIEPRGIAVALNGTVIPRSQWSATRISDGDVMEVVTAAAGG